MELILLYLKYPLRMLGAILCGALIGYERENQMKMAGIRTHSIVSLASALMMIVSKYGFFDVLSSHVNLDPSRIAAGVVTAIGFLGAGVIFTHKMNISGLTTSAGLWATVGVGMALGAGMYVPGITATVLILLLQFFFHRNFRWLKSSSIEQVTLIMEQEDDLRSILENTFHLDEIKITSMKVKRLKDDQVEVKLFVKFPDSYDIFHTLDLLRKNPKITSIDL